MQFILFSSIPCTQGMRRRGRRERAERSRFRGCTAEPARKHPLWS